MATFFTGDEIAEDGVYWIHHLQHRLVRTITLIKGEKFPKCLQCSHAVRFELLLPLHGLLNPAVARISEIPLDDQEIEPVH